MYGSAFPSLKFILQVVIFACLCVDISITANFSCNAANADCLNPSGLLITLLITALATLVYSVVHPSIPKCKVDLLNLRTADRTQHLGSPVLETLGIVAMALPYLAVSVSLGVVLVLRLAVDDSATDDKYQSHLVSQVVSLSVTLIFLLFLFGYAHWVAYEQSDNAIQELNEADDETKSWSGIFSGLIFNLSLAPFGTYLYFRFNKDMNNNAISTVDIVLIVLVSLGKLFTFLYFAYLRKAIFVNQPVSRAIATTALAIPYLGVSVLLGMAIGLLIATDHSDSILTALAGSASADEYQTHTRNKMIAIGTTLLLMGLPLAVGHYWGIEKRIRIARILRTEREPNPSSQIQQSALPSTIACTSSENSHSVERQRLLSCPYGI